MNDTMKEVMASLDALAAQLGVAAEHLWPALVRREMAEAAFGLALLVAFSAGAAWAFGSTIRGGRLVDSDGCPTSRGCVAIGLAVLALAGLAPVWVGLSPELVGRIVAPEAAALERLLKLLP